MRTCPKCGSPASIWSSGLLSGVCQACTAAEAKARAEADRLAEAERTRAAREAEDARVRQERDAHEKRYAAALRGEASAADLERLESDGYLTAGGQLIVCPVCRHDRFHQQRLLLNTRAATFFNMDWADSGADARICQRCTHVLWFARG